MKLDLSLNTIQQMVSRGVIRGQKINGLMYVDDDFIPKLQQVYEKKKAN